MPSPQSSSASGAAGPCPSWCLNDACSEAEDGFHTSATTSVPMVAGGATMVELHQDHSEVTPWLFVVVEGHQSQPAVERRLTPAEARSVAAHLLHHANIAEGLS